jgi:hypothetical protein
MKWKTAAEGGAYLGGRREVLTCDAWHVRRKRACRRYGVTRIEHARLWMRRVE